MTKEQQQHLESADAGLQILDNNHGLWSTQLAWENAHTKLVDNIELINSLNDIGDTDNRGAAAAKKTKRLIIGEKAYIICRPMMKYFEDQHDEVQGISVSFSASQLTYASEKTLLTRWKKLIDVASLPTNAAFFTGGYDVTMLMITDLQTERTAFETIAPTPKAKRSVKKTAKHDLKAEFKDQAKLIAGIVNLAQGKHATHKSFVEDIENAFGIDSTGNRLVNAVFTLRDLTTNVLLNKIKLTFTKGDVTFSQFSTKKGLVTVKGKEQGNWTLTIEGKTYVTQVLPDIAFDPEKPILKQTVKLVKA